MFKNLKEIYGDRIAVISDDNEVYSYFDLEEFSIQIAGILPPRSFVFSLCENNIESLLGYFSFIRNDIVPLMIDDSIDSELLLNLCKIYDPEYIWLPNQRRDLFPKNNIIFSFGNYSLLRISEESKFPLNENLALLMTTSGSTGSPKLVRLSYRNIEANALSIAQYLSIRESDRPITTLPMSYSFGLSVINSHLISGATILLTDKSIVKREFWNFLKDQGATSLSGVPYTFEILKKLRFFTMDTPSLRVLTQAGGKMHDEISLEYAKFCKDNGKKLFVMYGQTEATARMSYLLPDKSISKNGSIGTAIPGGVFSLINESGQVLNKSHEVGELVYRGENVSMGYAQCSSDLTKGDENNGMLLTGDLAQRDDEGFYYIVGRKKRFIKIYGNRINLDETEQLIKSITTNVACAGYDDKMIIYLTDEEFKDQVRSFISKKIGINLRGFEIKIIEEIPKTESGKTIYGELTV